jgi:hypothetical protein
MSTPTTRDALAPANGLAGAALGCGLFGILVAVLLGFAFVPFAVMAGLIGLLAVALGRRGRSFARAFGRRSRVATAGAASGSVATALGVLGVVLA